MALHSNPSRLESLLFFRSLLSLAVYRAGCLLLRIISYRWESFLRLGYESKYMFFTIVCCLDAGTGQSHLRMASCFDDVCVCVNDEFASTHENIAPRES